MARGKFRAPHSPNERHDSPSFRTLKCPPERPNRTVSREAMRRAVQAVHVMPSRDGWVARRMADDREHETFASREDARTFACSLAAELDVDVFLHDEGRYAGPDDLAA